MNQDGAAGLKREFGGMFEVTEPEDAVRCSLKFGELIWRLVGVRLDDRFDRTLERGP